MNWLMLTLTWQKGGKKVCLQGQGKFSAKSSSCPILWLKCTNTWAAGRQWDPQDKCLGLERLDCSSPRQCQLSSIWMAPAFPTESSLLSLPKNWVWHSNCSSPQQQVQEQQHTQSSGLLFLDQTPGRPRPCCTLCSANHLSQAGPG